MLAMLVAVALAGRVVSEEADLVTVRLILLFAGTNLATGFSVGAFAGIPHASLRLDLL
jgi:hypothetical protein